MLSESGRAVRESGEPVAVAVKIAAGGQGALKSWRREATALSQLRHTNIVRCLLLSPSCSIRTLCVA